MPITNYPQGVSSFGVPLVGAGPLGVVTTGQILFVNSQIGRDSNVDGSGQGTTPGQPFKTLSFAITQCNAVNTTNALGGDVIYLMPGHLETIAVGATLTLNKAGVTIIGLGNRNTRPTISYLGTASKILISASSITLRNVILLAALDEVVTAISVTGPYVELDAVDVVETSAKQFIQFVLTSALATDLMIHNCVHHQSTAPAANSLWIQLIGADRAKIFNNHIFITTTNSASSSVIESDTTAPVNIYIGFNRIVQLGGTSTIPINLVAATSGYAEYNGVASAKTAIVGSIALASCYGQQNFASHVVNKDGLLEPPVDT